MSEISEEQGGSTAVDDGGLPPLLADDDDDCLEMIQDDDPDEAGMGDEDCEGLYDGSASLTVSASLPAACENSDTTLDMRSSSRLASSPVPRLLPVRRAHAIRSASPLLQLVRSVPDVPPATGAAPPGTVESGSEPPSPTADSSAHAVDKIGAYFGYNGTDGNVPKPAYDAMLQRVRTLEDALGAANRELRGNAKTIADQQATISSQQQQLLHHEESLQRMNAMETQLIERERDLDLREQALESLSRHHRRQRVPKTQMDEGVDVGGYHQQPLSPAPLGAVGSLRRRAVNDALARCEEEAYAHWVSPLVNPHPHVSSVRGNAAAAGLEALLDNARRSGLLPRLHGQQQDVTSRSYSSFA